MLLLLFHLSSPPFLSSAFDVNVSSKVIRASFTAPHQADLSLARVSQESRLLLLYKHVRWVSAICSVSIWHTVRVIQALETVSCSSRPILNGGASRCTALLAFCFSDATPLNISPTGTDLRRVLYPLHRYCTKTRNKIRLFWLFGPFTKAAVSRRFGIISKPQKCFWIDRNSKIMV